MRIVYVCTHKYSLKNTNTGGVVLINQEPMKRRKKTEKARRLSAQTKGTGSMGW